MKTTQIQNINISQFSTSRISKVRAALKLLFAGLVVLIWKLNAQVTDLPQKNCQKFFFRLRLMKFRKT